MNFVDWIKSSHQVLEWQLFTLDINLNDLFSIGNTSA